MAVVDPGQALQRLGGVADHATLSRHCDAWRIRLACRSGTIERAGPNRYVLPSVTDAVRGAARVNGVVSHLSAALYWGWPVKVPPADPAVTVPRHRRLSPERRAGLDVRWRDLPAGTVAGGIATSRVQTVVDCARTLEEDAALSVVDSALREGLVSRRQLEAAAHAAPRTGRSKAVRAVRHGDPRAANPFESCARAIGLRVPGLHLVPQVDVGVIGRADLVDERLRLVVECDSYAFHAEPAAFRNDIRRYTAMVLAGWHVIRFCWEDVMFRQAYVEQVLRDAVAALQVQAVRG